MNFVKVEEVEKPEQNRRRERRSRPIKRKEVIAYKKITQVLLSILIMIGMKDFIAIFRFYVF